MYPPTAEYSHFVRTHIDGLCIPAQYEWNTNSDSPWSYEGLKKLPQFCILDCFQLSRQRACPGIFTQHCFIVPFILCCQCAFYSLNYLPALVHSLQRRTEQESHLYKKIYLYSVLQRFRFRKSKVKKSLTGVVSCLCDPKGNKSINI